MQTMSIDGTTITAAYEMTSSRMTLDPGTSGVHQRGVEVIVRTCAFHYGRVLCHAKKEAAIITTPTSRAISTTIVAIEDQKSDSNKDHVKATAVSPAKPHVINRLRGGSVSLNTA